MNDTWTRVTGNLVFSISLAAIGLFAAMLVALELGRRIGARRLAALPDLVAAKQALARSVQIQGDIWRGAGAACRADPTSSTTMLVLPALNTMIDITTTRTMVAENHPPVVIFAVLVALALASALLAGHGMAGRPRSWIHAIGFAASIATAAFVTLDI